MENNQESLKEKIKEITPVIETIKSEMAKVIVGQEKLVNRLLVGLLSGGHILLEGVPGLAKTTAISTLSRIVNLDFKRIQFTPDLLPSDLVGSRVFNQQENSFYVKKGPIFANFILADEINRSPAKVQSALLEAMQEGQVTIGDETFSLPKPFFVMATMNPIEQEGTYALPEAQVDRFLLKTVITYPTREEELKIINQAETGSGRNPSSSVGREEISRLLELAKEVYLDESIKHYIIDIVFASRFPGGIRHGEHDLKELISYGASPRASIGLMQASKAEALLNGRSFVIPEDIKEVALDVLRHRVMPTYEAEAENIVSEDIISALLMSVKVP